MPLIFWQSMELHILFSMMIYRYTTSPSACALCNDLLCFLTYVVSGNGLCGTRRSYGSTKTSWWNLSWPEVPVPWSRRGVALLPSWKIFLILVYFGRKTLGNKVWIKKLIIKSISLILSEHLLPSSRSCCPSELSVYLQDDASFPFNPLVSTPTNIFPLLINKLIFACFIGCFRLARVLRSS